MRYLLTLIALLFLAPVLPAQDVRLQVVPFRVDGYNIQQVGYPSRIVEGEEGRFYYVEYFKAGPGRREDNWYLQCVQPKVENGQEFVGEVWAKPVTETGKPKMEFLNLYGMKGCVVVVGKQPDPQQRSNMLTVAQFFTLGGQPIGPIRQISPFRTSLEGWQDEFQVSAGGGFFAWFARNPEHTARNAKYHIAVYADQEARKVFSLEFEIPEEFGGKKYMVRQMVLDRRGNPFFLIMPETMTGTATDTLMKPRLLRYAHAERRWEEYPLNLGGISWPMIQLAILEDDMLYAFAAVTQAEGTGMKNGVRLPTGLRPWHTFEFRKYSLMRNMALMADTSLAIPDTLVARYNTEDGCNFTEGRIVRQGDEVFWMLEEAYTSRKPQGVLFHGYDVLILKINPEDLAIQWATTVFKRQRNFGSDNLLGYVTGFSDMFLHIAYLTDIGAPGKILMQSINRESGGFITREMASNENGRSLFFPARSAQTGNRLTLMGVGIPNQPNYCLLMIKPLP